MPQKYKTVTRTQGNNRALKDASIKPEHFEFEFIEIPVLVDGFRRMVRELAFDICEMAITTYICAKAHGIKFTAIPVFLVRGFHHSAIMVNTKAGVKTPKDLEGKRVGVNRGYTVTTGVWARGVLQREYGVDLSKVTWVLSGDEHVAEYRAPENVVPMEKGRTMAEQLIAGDLAAAIGVEVDHPDVKPLIADATEVGLKGLAERGYYPINHLIVIKDELLETHPGLAVDIFNAFANSKKAYLEALKSGRIGQPDAADRLHQRVMEIIGDPLPYGIEPNRAMINELIDNAITQGIVSQRPNVDDLFAAETRKLIG
jgi:4,5-dihydroxyphthalate decarboxylase